MSEYKYTFSLETDFPNKLKSEQLVTEITDSVIIVKNIIRIDTEDDAVYIIFSESLDPTEETELTNLIGYHIPYNHGLQQLSFPITIRNIHDTIYNAISIFEFAGSLRIKNITHIKITGFLEAGTSYSLRLYDFTNNKTIASGTFTNSIMKIQNLGNIANIPLEASIFELHCKVASSSQAIIRGLTFYYD